MGFDNPIDISTPPQIESLGEGDNRIREAKSGWQEFLSVDHEASIIGTEIDSLDSGCHNKITLLEQTSVSAPTGLSINFGILHTKNDTDTSQSELFYKDENDNTLQITKGNKIDLDLNFLSNNTFLTGTNQAGDGVISMIKVNTSDKVEILVGAVLSADTDPVVNAGIANKKYVDNKIASEISTAVSGSGFYKTSGATIFSGSASSTNTFQDLDVSSVTGAVEALLYLELTCNGGNITNFRPKGFGSGTFSKHTMSGNGNSGVACVDFGAADQFVYIVITTNSSGIFEWGSESSSAVYTIKLIGYIK